jgi:hypothetical protein
MCYVLKLSATDFLTCCRTFFWGPHFLLAFAVATAGHSRLNLPQETAEVILNSAAKAEVDSVLESGSALAEGQLPVRVTQVLIESLPARLRNGCKEMISDFGANPAVSSAWSATLLHAEGDSADRSALVSFRCTVHIADLTGYDERPALLHSTKQATILKFLPLDPDCTNCSDLYHLRYNQRFEAAGGYLAELDVEHSTSNPCCDGGDRLGGTRLLLISVPEGASVLDFEKATDDYSHDDEAPEDVQTVCKSEVSYERDANRYLQAVTARMSCTQKEKLVPPILTRRFEWHPANQRFQERGSPAKHTTLRDH